LITSIAEIAVGVSLRSTERKEVGEPTSVDVLVSHAKVILAGLLTTTNPLHAVLPPLDIAFQEDPSVAEEIVFGKIGRVFGVGARLVHAYETLRKVNVPCPFAVETREDVSGGGTRWMKTRDIRRYVLLWTVHHCHREEGLEVVLKGERRRVGSKRAWRLRA